MPAPTALHCDFIISAHSLQAFKVNEADWKWSWTSGYSGAYKCAYCAHHAVQAAHWPQCCRLPPALVPRPHSPPPPALAALRPPAPSPAALHPATVLLNLLICFHRVKCHHQPVWKEQRRRLVSRAVRGQREWVLLCSAKSQ